MRVNEKMRKALSILLCLCMLLQNAPVMAFAVTTDNLCEHHTEHTAECGYREGSAGSACTHEHSEDCYAILECLHTCGEECADGCTHECTVENGCITMELDCHHVHGDCGYSEGTAEVPCGHVHNESCGYVEVVYEVLCDCAETDESGNLIHTEGCGYVAAVEGQPCGHTACDDTCGYAPATEGTPCTHVCEVKVDSDDSCYKLLCSHKDGGHDDACGYAEAVEAHECHYECAECANSDVIANQSADWCGNPLCSQEDAFHVTSCTQYVAPENPVCYCAEKCTEVNEWCDVCGFDYSKCTGTDTAVQYDGGAIDLSTLTGTYVISDSGEYTFTGSGSYGIKVESGNPTIVLNNASITVGKGSSAIDVASGSNATIFVMGDNTVDTDSEWGRAGGIFVAEGGTVNITSNSNANILRAHGSHASAIGGKYDYDNNESYNAGNINISNVTVYAYTNNFYASAIGAAGEGTCGTINITNAVIYAYGAGDKWTSAPGIGSAMGLIGYSEMIPVVIISDSEVHTFRHPYVKHTTKNFFLQKQKSQTIIHTAMVWDSGFFNHLGEQILNRTGLGFYKQSQCAYPGIHTPFQSGD